MKFVCFPIDIESVIITVRRKAHKSAEVSGGGHWLVPLVLILFVVAGVTVSVLPRMLATSSIGSEPDEVLQESFEKGEEQMEVVRKRMRSSPGVVLIGNSMLNSRVDKKLLREISGSFHAEALTEGNTFSPVWYLTMKEVAQSEEPPRVMVIFFRDRFLTWPGFRFNETGEAFARGMMAGDEDPLVTKLFATGEEPGLKDDFAELKDVLKEADGEGVDQIESLAMDLTKISSDKDERREAMNRRFSMENLRSDVPDDLGDEIESQNEVTMNGYTNPAEFSRALKNSLLPDMVRLAKENGVRLIVYRVKRRPDMDSGLRASSESLERYLRDLNEWLGERDVLFLDENASTEFTVEDYADGDHISRNVRPAFTRWFWSQLLPHLEQ